jgi:hypothetical protein
MLFIVARDQPALYEALRREFAQEPEIEVVLDRRHGESGQPEREGSVTERRMRADIQSQLRSLGWAFVRSPRPHSQDRAF